MTKTIVAIYDDIVVARQVVEDLVNADFARSSISLITNDANNQYSRYLDKDYAPREDAVTAGEGARFGSVVGALTGLLVGVAALMIPGIGLAIVAGPIVGAVTGMVAGAVTGGIAGALVKSGVPEDEAPYYAEGIRRGGTLVSIETSDTLLAQDIMNRNGATNIHERSNLWRQAGWKGFDAESVENEAPAQAPVVMLPAAPPDTAATEVMAVNRNANPLTIIAAVAEEPQINDEDTANELPLMATVATTDTGILVTPKEMTVEPVLLVVDKESQVENEDTAT